METWKILLITFLSAVVLGGIAGVVIGKQQLKRQRDDYKPLLTGLERGIYLGCVTLGVVLILIGIFQPFTRSSDDTGENLDMGMWEEDAGMVLFPEGDVAVDGTEENAADANAGEEDPQDDGGNGNPESEEGGNSEEEGDSEPDDEDPPPAAASTNRTTQAPRQEVEVAIAVPRG